MSRVNYWRWRISELHQSMMVLSHAGLPCCILLHQLGQAIFPILQCVLTRPPYT